MASDLASQLSQRRNSKDAELRVAYFMGNLPTLKHGLEPPDSRQMMRLYEIAECDRLQARMELQVLQLETQLQQLEMGKPREEADSGKESSEAPDSRMSLLSNSSTWLRDLGLGRGISCLDPICEGTLNSMLEARRDSMTLPQFADNFPAPSPSYPERTSSLEVWRTSLIEGLHLPAEDVGRAPKNQKTVAKPSTAASASKSDKRLPIPTTSLDPRRSNHDSTDEAPESSTIRSAPESSSPSTPVSRKDSSSTTDSRSSYSSVCSSILTPIFLDRTTPYKLWEADKLFDDSRPSSLHFEEFHFPVPPKALTVSQKGPIPPSESSLRGVQSEEPSPSKSRIPALKASISSPNLRTSKKLPHIASELANHPPVPQLPSRKPSALIPRSSLFLQPSSIAPPQVHGAISKPLPSAPKTATLTKPRIPVAKSRISPPCPIPSSASTAPNPAPAVRQTSVSTNKLTKARLSEMEAQAPTRKLKKPHPFTLIKTDAGPQARGNVALGVQLQKASMVKIIGRPHKREIGRPQQIVHANN